MGSHTSSVARLAAARLGAALGALLLAACGAPPSEPARPAGIASVAPRSVGPQAAMAAGPTCGGATTHEKHINQFTCITCHPCGGQFGFDVVTTFPGGTTTEGGTLTRGTATTPTTCAVGCHSPLGSPVQAVSWAAPGPLACTACHAPTAFPPTHPGTFTSTTTRAECEACHAGGSHLQGTVSLVGHPPGWVDQASAGFHAFSANRGLASCQQCHGQDLAGGATGVACGRCHDASLPAGVTSWKTSCVMCHGGTDSQTGAPPAALWGQAGDPTRGGGPADPVRVGAHATHLGASAISPAISCGTCHVVPTDALSAAHVEASTGTPTAEVTFSGAAAAGGASPAWSRTDARCSNVYCHGATLAAGGTTTSPTWTGGAAQAACGSCHGVPPPAPHPAAADLAACASCHPLTMTSAGALIAPGAGGKHLDGVVEASGGHAASWMDPTSPAFHASSANLGLASCQGCHGVNLDGVGGSASTACASCHQAGGPASDLATCTGCHGGTADQTGAPPRATWGNQADPVRVGAHAIHVNGSARARPIDCTACHVKPTSWLSAGHVDGAHATVTFGGISATSGATPTWDRGTATCATTYCHGGYSGTYAYFDPVEELPGWVEYAGSGAAPRWTDGPMTCTSCHGMPPLWGNWHSGYHGGFSTRPLRNACSTCHPGVDLWATVITDPSRHVNGVVDVTPTFVSSCLGCHP